MITTMPSDPNAAPPRVEVITLFRQRSKPSELTDCRSGMRCCGLRHNVLACGVCSLKICRMVSSCRAVNPFKRANDRLIDEVLPPETAGR
jgi:hypothetical protein